MALATHISGLAVQEKEQDLADLSTQRRVGQGKQEGRVESLSWKPCPSLSPSLFIAGSVPGTLRVSSPGSSLPLGAGLLQTRGLLSTDSGHSTSYWSWAQGLRLCPGLE